jgi:hypothetical protein
MVFFRDTAVCFSSSFCPALVTFSHILFHGSFGLLLLTGSCSVWHRFDIRYSLDTRVPIVCFSLSFVSSTTLSFAALSLWCTRTGSRSKKLRTLFESSVASKFSFFNKKIKLFYYQGFDPCSILFSIFSSPLTTSLQQIIIF